MKNIGNFIIALAVICYAGLAGAQGFDFGTHAAIGKIKYEESFSDPDGNIESDADLTTFIYGLYGDWAFTEKQNFFLGAAAEWEWGSQDRETWTQNGVDIQTNDLRIFNQFYDLRIGYKNSNEKLDYKLYALAGWDGMELERDNIEYKGTIRTNAVTEDFNLWKAGGGLDLRFKSNRWGVDGRAAYAYYFDGEQENDANVNKYNIDGYRFDGSIGISYEFIENLNMSLGATYTYIDLDLDEASGTVDSKFKIPAGFIRLTYSF